MSPSTPSAPSIRSALPSAVRADELVAAIADGALVVDIRSHAQRQRQGTLPGAPALDAAEASELLDRQGPRPLAALAGASEVVLVSEDGFDAQLFTWELHSRGVTAVRALEGGFDALAAAGGRGVLAEAEHVRRERAAIAAH